MKTRICLSLVGAILLISSLAFSQQTDKAESLYQEALMQMEGRGNYSKALEIFGQILKDFPGNRRVSAKAQFQIGVCYEKLGKSEAQKAYERVIKEFADQQEVVKEARARLSALITAAPKPSLTVRQVWAGPGVDVEGGISPDGRYLSYVDWDTGDLAIREITTGEKRRLTNKGGWDEAHPGYAFASRWSPDCKQVIYTWIPEVDASESELRIVGLDGSEPRILYRSGEVEWVEPADWSPDGKCISARILRKDKPLQLGLVSIADGSVRILKTLEVRDPHMSIGPLFSPDGRYVAYSFPPRDDAADHDIFLLTIDGGHEVALVQHPAKDYLLGWSPDGKKVLFASDRTGTIDAWVINVAEGKPQGVPQLVRRDMGSISPMGLTQKGCFYYATTPGSVMDIFTITLDPATGKIITPPNKEALPYEGRNMSPDWSPDGKYLAYNSMRGHMNRRSIICIYSPETGKVRELLARLSLYYPRWTPDGGSILVQPTTLSGQGIYRMDATTGEVVPFIPIRKESKEYLSSAQLSADGKLVFYVRENQESKLCQILVRNLETGEEKELDRAPFDNHSIALSPDGRRLALLIRAEKQLRVLKVMPSNGGEQTELHRFEQSGRWIIDIAWTPDGRHIFFSKARPDWKWELWRIPSEGGEPQNLGLSMPGYRFQHLSVHPDGRRVTFASRPTEAELPEVWMMENFLAKELETSGGLTLRKLEYAQLNTPFARLSPDGKKMASVVYIGGSPKRIDILDLNSGTAKVLVDSGAGSQSSLVWSPQSDKIAYTFCGKELHVRDIDGANSRVLLKNSEYQIYPSDWSRDGKKILCFFEGDDWTTRIGIITSDGQVQFLASGNTSDFRSEPKFSPDGKHVTCSLGEKTGNSDIYVWAADGSRKARVTDHPGRDENPVWSPDGKHLAFLSDRNRSVDLWGVQMQGGATVGAPFIIKQDLGWRTRIYDFTASGKLSLFMLGGAEPSNLFTVPVDQANGRLSGTIAPISVYPTDHFFPRYSPNGKMVAYLSRRGQIGWPKLFVLDEKGSERELPLQGHYVVNFAWHPGNRSLFFAGWDKTYKAGIYELSLEKDEIKSVYSGERVDLKTFKAALININLLPDAKKMMFFRYLEKGDVEVLTCEPDGQHLAVVLSRVNMPVWGSPSPSGENICYRIADSLMLVSVSNGVSKLIGSATLGLEATWAPHGERLMFREGSGLRIFSLKENTCRTVYQAPAGKTIGGMEMYGTAWSPNGGRVIFTERDTSASSTSPQKLFLVSPGDGSLKTIGEAPEGYRLSELRWSPDGSKIVATGRSISSARAPIYEYWVMENFLPKEVREKR